MKIVIDSNIIFSALIKDSLTRKLIFELENLLMPEIVFKEIENYRQELIDKSKLNWNELQKALKLIIKNIEIIPNDVLEKYKKKAWELIGTHSPEDVMFIACCLKFEDSILWSDDKKLKLQNKIQVLNTQEIVKTLI